MSTPSAATANIVQAGAAPAQPTAGPGGPAGPGARGFGRGHLLFQQGRYFINAQAANCQRAIIERLSDAPNQRILGNATEYQQRYFLVLNQP